MDRRVADFSANWAGFGNHARATERLIHGERYNTFNVPSEVLEEAATVVDVRSVQPYDAKFNAAKFDEWHALTGNPMVISD